MKFKEGVELKNFLLYLFIVFSCFVNVTSFMNDNVVEFDITPKRAKWGRERDFIILFYLFYF